MAETASARPYIFNAPFTAKPGDFVSLTGSGFGPKPRVFLKLAGQTSAIELQGIKGTGASVVARLPKAIALSQYEVWLSDDTAETPHVFVNAPRAMHFDAPETAPSRAIRVFGRNLYLGSATPSASFVDAQTGAALPAQINIAASDAYCLSLVAPAGLVAGKTYKVLVSNGYGSAPADKTIVARAGVSDKFGLGTSWGADLEPADPKGKWIFDVKNDAALTLRAKGDGVTNDAPAIQAAIEKAKTIQGAVVYLPAGVYYLGGEQSGPGLLLRSNTMLQGAGITATKLIYGPRTPKESSYSFAGLSIQAGSNRVGLVGMSIQNLDRTSQNVVNLTTDSGAISTRIFLSQVNWDLGSGKGVYIKGDKIAIINSTFRQTPNRQFAMPDGSSGSGPLGLSSSTNLLFRGNTVAWASGELQFNDISSAFIESNRFTRSALDQMAAGPQQTSWPSSSGKKIEIGEMVQRGMGRNLSVNFGTDTVIQNNIFEVSDGVLKHNWSDGETILSEGGALKPRQDSGMISAATATSFTDGSRCSTCAWNVTPQSMVVLISGAGAGQWRNVTGQNGNTFAIDAPWDVVPAAGDRFALAQPSFKNVIIRKNTMSNNPIGVSLYDGSYLNVAIVSNNLTNNGGIYLRPAERARAQWRTFGAYRNIEINNNVVKNTNGYKPAYISAFFALVDQPSFWGRGMDGVEVRNNQLTAKPGTAPLYPTQEGYGNYVVYQNAAARYVENGEKPLVGTIFQGNSCVNCPASYLLTTGVLDTVIWNAATINNAGAKSAFIDDRNIAESTAIKSVGTVTGND